MRSLVATGIGSRVHLMRIRTQQCAHDGADRPRSSNLKRAVHLATRLAPAHAHGSATTSDHGTTICDTCAPRYWWISPQHSAAPLGSEEHTSELQSLRHLVC